MATSKTSTRIAEKADAISFAAFAAILLLTNIVFFTQALVYAR